MSKYNNLYNYLFKDSINKLSLNFLIELGSIYILEA